MKRIKWYFKKIIAIILALLFVFFFGCMAYFLYKKDSGTAGVYATLAALLFSISIAYFQFLVREDKKNNLIKRYFNDEHFVDRKVEYKKLENLITHEPDRIIYIRGHRGMGKTSFVKMVCDRINFTDKKRWKSYAAFYFCDNGKKKISQSISSEFCGHPTASPDEISKQLSSATFRKKSILFLDDINDRNLNECIEFANAFIKCSASNQIVIVQNSGDNSIDICPGKFGENEIDLLAHSYNIEIEQSDRNEISELSNGYPVYARYIVEAYTKGIRVIDYDNLENYINELIKSLNNMERSSLSLIICLNQMLQEGIDINILCGIDNRITKPIIKQLVTSSLVNNYKNRIYTDKLISVKCLDFLSEYKNESYKKIYQYYKDLINDSYIALIAALKSNFEYDHNLVREILHKQYTDGNFYLLIDIGEMELKGQINPHLREDKECWIYVRYYYLKSLLELGLYDRAREVVDSYDNQFSILSINDEIDFEYQYLLADLDHLTNYLKDAIVLSESLLQKTSNILQRAKCKYLYAHCLRHIGEDLDHAYTIFLDLAKDTDYNDDKIKIRSIYSAASIKMFQGDTNYPYEQEFDKIDCHASNYSSHLRQLYR